MPRFFSNKRMILLLLSFICLVAIIAMTLRDRHNASFPEQVVKDVVGLGNSVFSKPAHFLTGIFSDIDGIMDSHEENKKLKERLNEYASIQAKLTAVTSENERLREIVDKEDDLSKYDPIHAMVIARNPDQWEEKIIINKGELQGIARNMPVITARGLIGKVVLTTPLTATVELLSTENQDFRVSAMIQAEEPLFGLIESFDRERGELIMKRIDSAFEAQPGQLVTSSGLGGIFPQGLLIGEVTEVTTDDYGLTKMAYIKPAAQFTMLDHVIVAKRGSTVVDGTDGEGTANEEGDDSE